MDRTNYFFISTILHITVFFLIGIYFEFSTKSKPLGHVAAVSLNSYIYSGTISHAHEVTSVKQPVIQKKLIQVDKHGIKKMEKNNHKITPAAIPKAANSISQGEQTHALIALLHDAIQKAQNYPPAALQMQRQGRVTVAFTLLTDGSVTHLKMIASSGTASLDQAALTAVNEAAPFIQLRQYIQEAADYQIDIVFELT